MESPPRRSSNLAGMLTPGRHLYHAGAEDPGQLVDVQWEDGLPLATVVDGEDVGLVLDAREMPGTFETLR
jgi:hypothetical protein